MSNTTTTPIPVPVNPTVQATDQVIQFLLYTIGVNSAVASIITGNPWLGLPVVKQIFTFFVSKIADVIYKQLDLFVDFSIVDFQTAEQASHYLTAVNQLQAAIQSGSQNDIQAAKVNFNNAADAVIRFNGA